MNLREWHKYYAEHMYSSIIHLLLKELKVVLGLNLSKTHYWVRATNDFRCLELYCWNGSKYIHIKDMQWKY